MLLSKLSVTLMIVLESVVSKLSSKILSLANCSPSLYTPHIVSQQLFLVYSYLSVYIHWKSNIVSILRIKVFFLLLFWWIVALINHMQLISLKVNMKEIGNSPLLPPAVLPKLMGISPFNYSMSYFSVQNHSLFCFYIK